MNGARLKPRITMHHDKLNVQICPTLESGKQSVRKTSLSVSLLSLAGALFELARFMYVSAAVCGTYQLAFVVTKGF